MDRTIKAAAAFLSDAVLCGACAARNGLLQKIDPRLKLPATLALIVSVSVVRSPWSVGAFLLSALVLAASSRIGLRFFIRRVFPFIFLFGIVAALPAVFNVITPGDHIWVVADLGHAHVIGPFVLPAVLAVTHQGLAGAALFAGRVAASISLAVLLPLTTRWDELLRGFRALRVPQLFIMIMAMTYRYIALLVQSIEELHGARRSRTVRYLPTMEEQRWVASRVGFLFVKSYLLSQEVHDAMIARAFGGEVTILADQKPGVRDVAFLLLVLLLCAGLVAGDRSGW